MIGATPSRKRPSWVVQVNKIVIDPDNYDEVALIWIGIVGVSGFLMVSTWRFWSGKEINFSRRHPFQLLFLLAAVLYVMIRFSNFVLFFMALAYMFSGLWAGAAYSWSRRRRRRPADDPASEAAATEPDPLRPL